MTTGQLLWALGGLLIWIVMGLYFVLCAPSLRRASERRWARARSEPVFPFNFARQLFENAPELHERYLRMMGCLFLIAAAIFGYELVRLLRLQ